VFSCLGFFSCIELYTFLCRLVLFVSTLAKSLAGKTYSGEIFRVEGVFHTKTRLKSYIL